MTKGPVKNKSNPLASNCRPARHTGNLPNRRLALSGLAGGSLAMTSIPQFIGSAQAGAHITPSPDAKGPIRSEFVFFDDQTAHQKAAFRILRNNQDEADVLFWYHFIMFAIPEGQRPVAVVRWEGIEFSHHRMLKEGHYRVHGHNLSFPRDINGADWISETVNPVTQVKIEIPPMALTQDPGYIYTPAGVIPLDDPTADPVLRFEQFRIENDLMKIEQVRQPPASWPAEFIETSTNWSRLDQFEDNTLDFVPAGTSGGYIFPWPEWMKMGNRKGRMFAQWSGQKLQSTDELPEEFRERAEGYRPELLKVDMSVFETPLPEPLSSIVDSKQDRSE